MPESQFTPFHLDIGRNPDIERVLVFGGAGVIGSNLIAGLRDSGYLVRAVEHRSRLVAGPGVEVVQAPADSLSAHSPAMRDVQAVCVMVRTAAEASPEEWIECTIRDTWHLLEAVRGCGIRRVVIGCGDNVFGVPSRPTAPVLNETSVRRSNGTRYSMSKLLEQELIQQYREDFDLPVVVTFFPLVWRDDLLATGLRMVDREAGVIWHEVDEAGMDLVRPGIHVSDATRAILLALRGECALKEDFFFSAAKPCSSSQIISILQRAFPFPVKTICRKWHSWSIDCGKAAALLGYSPRVDLLAWLASQLGTRSNGLCAACAGSGAGPLPG